MFIQHDTVMPTKQEIKNNLIKVLQYKFNDKALLIKIINKILGQTNINEMTYHDYFRFAHVNLKIRIMEEWNYVHRKMPHQRIKT